MLDHNLPDVGVATAQTTSAAAKPSAAPAARVNSGCFAHGKDPRRRSQKPRLASSTKARAVAHSRGTGQLCKAAVDGSIRGSGAFVIISFSQAGNVNFFSTSEDAGISTDDWLDPELQRWLQSRQTGQPFSSSCATHGGFSASNGILGQSRDETDEQRQHKRRRAGRVSSAVEPTNGNLHPKGSPGAGAAVSSSI